MLSDTDPYYRLHRIESIVQNSWVYPLYDHKIEYPKGYPIAWPLGLDYIIATPLKVMGVKDRYPILIFSLLIIPILMLPWLFLGGAVAERMTNSKVAGLGAGLFLTLNPYVLGLSRVGSIDHHALEGIFVLLLLWLYLKLKESSSKWTLIFFVLAAGLAPSIYPHGWFPSALLCVGLLFEKDSTLLMRISKLFFCAGVLSLLPLSLSNRFASGYITMSGFSWWSTMCLMIATMHVYAAACIRAKRVVFDKIYTPIQMLTALVVFSFLFFKNSYDIISGEAYVLGHFLVAKGGTLGETFESLSPLKYPSKFTNTIYLLCFMPVVYIWLLYRRKYFFYLWMTAIPIAMTMVQVRFMSVAACMMGVLLVLFVHDVGSRLKLKNSVREVGLLLSVLAISIFYMPKLGFTNIGPHGSYFLPVRAASIFLKNDVAKKKIEPDQAGVLSEWDYGHWILYYADLPVVASPFQGSQAWMAERLFFTTTKQDFENFQKDIPVKYLVLDQDIKRFMSTIEYVGEDYKNYFLIQEIDGKKRIRPNANFQKTFYHRMSNGMGVDENGDFPDHWRVIYVSPYASDDSPTLPALKVFEHVRGAVIEYPSKADELWLQIHILDKTMEYVVKKKSTKHGGVHRWTVPYAKYNQENVEVEGVYRILDAKGRTVASTPPVEETQVQQGETIRIK